MFKLLLVLAMISEFVLCGKIDNKSWDSLKPNEKKAVVSLFTDKYLANNKCEKAEFRLMLEIDEVKLYARCIEKKLEV